MVSKCSVHFSCTQNERETDLRKEVFESMKESCNAYVKNILYRFFSWAHTDTYTPHTTYSHIIRNLLKENVKKANYAWSVKWTHGRIWRKKEEEATMMFYGEKLYIACGNIFYVSVYCTIFTYGCFPWWWADMNDSVFHARYFLDRKCVWDGKYLLTRYDKPPKHFQFWCIHIFRVPVDGWPCVCSSFASCFLLRFRYSELSSGIQFLFYFFC